MPRPALYSSSRLGHDRARSKPAEAPVAHAAGTVSTANGGDDVAAPPHAVDPPGIVISRSQIRVLWAAFLLLTILLVASAWLRFPPASRAITQKDIDAAVMRTLQETVPPSAVARAVETVAPSVVRVAGFTRGKNGKDDVERSVGTGVVIVDKGIILTNLHVVSGVERITVTFHDGLETTASITGAQPETDLAVLRVHKVPDDLQAAALRSTQGLRPGDHVVSVGFPFGIGPSASAGVVSGLEREFTSPEGKSQLKNLIQFDAAANPGNSGGPLVTLDGEVVGIVTAILNPTPARTFLGIAFAVPIENAASAVGMSPF
ncbi:MAG: S1C family serine protease [Acidovorax sp.]